MNNSAHIPVLDRIVRHMVVQKMRGSGLLRRALGAIRKTDEIVASANGGALFQLRSTDYIDNCILRYGYYEPEVLNAILEALPERGIFWDIGANFGLHAITVKVMRPDITVVAFEPSPDMATRILRHSRMNQAPVTVLCLGLGDVSKPCELHISQDNAGLTSFVPWPEAKYGQSVYSHVAIADDLLGVVPAPDVIKMDIEGCEEPALAGMRNLLSSKKVKRLIVERGDVLSALIEPHGYRLSLGLPSSERPYDPAENFIFDRAS